MSRKDFRKMGTKDLFLSSLYQYIGILICSMIAHAVGAPPESIGIPILPSKLQGKSQNGIKNLMQSHSASKLLSQLSGGDVTSTDPKQLSHLIRKLNEHEGRLDPVMTDMFSALDRSYRDTTAAAGRESSTELFPDEGASNRVASSTEENGIIWQDNMHRPFKRNRNSNKFSSRYRSKNEYPSVSHSGNKKNGTMDNAEAQTHSGSVPFNHVNDPNLRNHRLYDWEFETYKNFTHIDQAEDLLAEEDHATETKVSVVTTAPPSNYSAKQHAQEKKPFDSKLEPVTFVEKAKGAQSKRVKVKGIPHIVISLEDTSENGYGNGQERYKVHLPMDSGEQSLHQRPREPLRHSSNENIVYVHGDSGEVGRYPYATRDPARTSGDSRNTVMRRQQHVFRPSTADLSDAVFLDPDEDFFTSTVRNTSPHVLTDQEISSETLPKRRRKKLKKITRKEEMDEIAQSSNRFNNRLSDMDDIHSRLQYSPLYSKNAMMGTAMNEDRARAHLGNIQRGSMQPTQYPGMDTNRMKSDRVLNAGDNNDDFGNEGQPMNPANFEHFDPSMHHHDGNIGNYYSLHTDPSMQPSVGPATPETASPYGVKNNYDLTSTEYLGNGNRFQNALNALNIFNNQRPAKKLQASVADQIIAPGNVEDFYHPYAASDHQVNQFYEDSYPSSWSNTWFILAGLILFTAVFAFLLPLFLQPGRMGKKDHRHDLDEDDILNDNFPGSGSNNNYVFDNTNNDAGQNSDLWTEIKGVYNDLVSMVRGDYSILQKLKKVPEQGPKIVYREDEHELEDEDSDEDEEDDEKSDNRVNVRNRKRERFMKKQQKMQQKKQQQEIKRQQQQQQQQTPVTQAKSQHHAFGKKTLLSKIKAEVGRDNKDDGKTIEASSVNNLVVFSGPGGPMGRQLDEEEEEASPRSATGFAFPINDTFATMAPPLPRVFINATGYANPADSFLREWAQVQLINNQ